MTVTERLLQAIEREERAVLFTVIEGEPLAGGMRAALPHVDRFLPGHNLASLEDLAGVLAGIERRHAA